MRQQDLNKAATEPMEAWSRLWLGSFGGAQQSGEPAVKNWTSAQREMMEFANRRSQAWFELPKQLADCRGPQDLVATSTAFWQGVAGDWNSASRRIMSAWGVPTASNGTPQRDHLSFGDDEQPARNGTSNRSDGNGRKAA